MTHILSGLMVVLLPVVVWCVRGLVWDVLHLDGTPDEDLT